MWPYWKKRSFADVTKILWCYHPELTGWALNPIPNILVGRGENTEKKAGSRGDGGRDWSDAATSQGTLGAAKAGKGKDGFSLGAFGGSVAPSEVELILGLPDYERLSSHCF